MNAPLRLSFFARMLLGCLALATLANCDTGSVARACEPARQTGCEDNEFCAVDRDGVPGCLVGEEVPEATDCPGESRAGCRTEGAVCETSAQCASGLGCLRVGGVARCLRFCEAEGEADGPATCDATARPVEEGGHPLGAASKCAGLLPDRPDIGVCLLPCNPGDDDQCPEGLRCGLVSGLTTCVAEGTGDLGEDCANGGACKGPLLCARWGSGRVCRTPASAEGVCAEGIAVPLANTRTVADDGPVAVCQTCLDVAEVAGRRFIACPGAWTAEAAGAVCEAEGGVLADLAGSDAAGVVAMLTAAQSALRDQDTEQLWTSGVVAESRWRWGAEGFEVDGSLWAGSEPAADQGQCAALVLDTGLQSVACGGSAASLCVTSP